MVSQRLQKSLPNVVGFESLLVMPVQRIPRYLLLLRDLLEKTAPTHPDHNNLVNAMQEFEGVMRYIDRDVGDSENMKRFIEMSKVKGTPVRDAMR